MQQFPHRYAVEAAARNYGDVRVSGDSVPDFATEFDGPGDRWSPETLLVAAVGSCFITTFRSIARASRFEWTSMSCQVDGTLDKTEGGIEFTDFIIHVELTLPDEETRERAHRLLEKAKEICLITNSLRGETRLEVCAVAA
jgi:peroxiredoxin-like protein